MDEQLSLFPEPAPPAIKPKRKIPKKKAVLVKRKKKAKPAPPETLKVYLTIRHVINGIPYGPGLVEGPADLIMTLRENEQRNIREEAGLTEKPRSAHIIMPGARTIDVHPNYFDDPDSVLGMTPVAVTQSFRDVFYNPTKGAQQG